MQIKSTKRYHLTSVRMAIIKKNTIDAGKDMEEKEFSYMVGRNVNWCSHWGEQHRNFSKKKK